MKDPRLTQALDHGRGDKRIDILRGIGRTGSISQAARDAGVSYKAAWQAIDTLTNLSGAALVERSVGGTGGGGAALTEAGRHLLELAEAFDAARARVQQQWLGGAGAGSPRSADMAHAPLGLRTSMRNQLPVRVALIEIEGPVVRVALALDAMQGLYARITRESLELLGLSVGMRAIAMCKATSVRVGAGRAFPDRATSGGRQRVEGRVSRITRAGAADSPDEVVLSLGEAGQLVGFAPHANGLRARSAAWAEVDESAVVVALPG